jgi:pSer/pThr/pTyr-binding forkhead associated (FHA) protein
MARLMLSLDGSVLAEYNMNKERYTIGRLPDNDIRIDNPAVSGHHSLIINILNDSFLEDLNSTNGTYVNGKLIKKHAMQHGDVITVGHHQLRFVDSQDGETEQDEFEKTMVITPSTQGEERIRRVGVAVDQAAKAVAAKRPALPPRVSRERHRAAQGQAAGAERRLRRPRTGIDQGADHLGAPACRWPPSPGAPKATSSCTSTAARKRLSAGQRRAHRSAGPSPERQRRGAAGRRQDGVLRELIAGS